MYFPPLAFVVALAVMASSSLAKACVADGVVRAMETHRYSASAFCTSFIRSTSTQTITIPTTTLTSTDVTVTPRTTEVSTLTLDVFTFTTLTVTSTTSLYPNPNPNKRDGALEARGSVYIPPYLSHYNSYQLSSACSCFISPYPCPIVTTTTVAIWTKEVDATTTLPTQTVTTHTYATSTATHTYTTSTTIPDCGPIHGCSINGFALPDITPATAEYCQSYCDGFGGCLSYQLGLNATTGQLQFCRFIGIEGWRAWDPNPPATPPSPPGLDGIGGGNCKNFWIYERACPYVPGKP